MINQVLYRPYVYSSAWAPLIWQVSSTKTSEIDFKYVFDIYINGTFNNRIKQRPNPAGYGLIDVSSFTQASLTPGQDLVENAGYTGVYRDGKTITGEIYLLAGEEYRPTAGSQLAIYNGVTDTLGSPQFWLGPADDGVLWTIGTGTTGTVIFTSSYKNSIDNYDLNRLGFAATDYRYSMDPGKTGKVPPGEFLTRLPAGSPRQCNVQLDDRLSFSFWNNNFKSPSYVDQIRVQYFGLTGILGTTALNNPGTGSTASNNVMQFSCGPVDLNLKTTGVPTGTKYYTIRAQTAAGITALSETIRVNLVDPDCWKAGRWRFSWLNSLGGRDWFNFVKQNTSTYTSDRTTYYRLEKYWSSGVYGANTLAPDTYGDTVSSNTIEVNHTAMTDWITEEESIYLQELFTSSHVLGWDPDNRGPFLVKINSKTYEVKNYSREKMFNYTIDFSIGQPVNAQNT